MTDTRRWIHTRDARQQRIIESGLLTHSQVRRMAGLPDGHEVVGLRGRAPIVREPDGQLLRMGPSGRLVVSNRVEPVRSYLSVRE